MEKQKSNPLLCFLCNKTFKRPKILDCLHSYCEKCLQDMQKSNKQRTDNIRCPDCRQITPVGVCGAKANIFLARLVEDAAVSEIVTRSKSAAAEISCNVCKKREAACRCSECAVFLCVVCRAYHGQLPATSGHGVYTLEECRAGKAGGVTGRFDAPDCPDHTGERCRFYCLTCRKLICRDCTVLDRSSSEPHEYTSLAAAAPLERHAADALLSRLENKVPDLETSLHVLEEMGPALKKRSDMAKAKVQAVANKIRESLAEEEKRLLKEIRLESQKELKALKENQNEVSATLNNARSSLKSTRLFVQRSTDTELLWLHPTLVKHLEGLVLKDAPGEPLALSFTESDDDMSLGVLTKENITEAVKAAVEKTKGKEKPTSRRVTEKASTSRPKEPTVSSNKENPPPESEDCSDSEDGSNSEDSSDPEDGMMGSSSLSVSDKPSTLTKQPIPIGRDTPADRKELGRQPAGTSAPKMKPASEPARKPKDAAPPSDRILRSSSKANATQNQASSRPANRQQAGISVAPELGQLTEDAVDSPDCGQALHRDGINPSLMRVAGLAKKPSQMTQPEQIPTRLSQQERQNRMQAPTMYTSAPSNDFNYNPNFAAAAGLFASSVQHAKDEEPTHPDSDRAQEATVHGVQSHQDYPLITSPNIQRGDIQRVANKYDTDSDDSDL
ncbi:E3 ubiquitin-protein ligase TRIM56-like [Patiria miniata]|uniref:Uncharacterized protein n=1 Tax=Patiria miniata TaxID=46514 RepID=A0A913ZFG0_PATMI|nr:E3 ubiquitin-protein ligase TRIM56-like [Patiria miniata]